MCQKQVWHFLTWLKSRNDENFWSSASVLLRCYGSSNPSRKGEAAKSFGTLNLATSSYQQPPFSSSQISVGE